MSTLLSVLAEISQVLSKLLGKRKERDKWETGEKSTASKFFLSWEFRPEAVNANIAYLSPASLTSNAGIFNILFLNQEGQTFFYANANSHRTVAEASKEVVVRLWD